MQRQLVNSIYTQIAGLIIVAPYLIRLFSELNFTQENQFVDLASQQRAVQLLGYVAAGQTNVEEYLLPFAKVLCNMPIDQPIALDHPLTTSETNLADEMLAAVLQNWDKMSSSTVENLRGSFLLRDGMLEEDTTDFYIRVESNGYDIILSFLPWNISTLQLPWMKKVVYVDWNMLLS